MAKKLKEFRAYDIKGNLISRILKEESIIGKIKIAVYDEKDNFKGYKVDSFWNIHYKRFKPHFLKGFLKCDEPIYLKNLEKSLNDAEEGAEYQKIFPVGSRISVESIETGEELMRYEILKNSEGKYSWRKVG